MAARVEDLLECAICLEDYTDPRVLPCQHAFCCSCLQGHINTTTSGAGTFACPQCRKRVTHTDPRGARSFPVPFLINSLRDRVRESAAGGATSACAAGTGLVPAGEHCENGHATITVSFCKDCAKVLCARCTESHEYLPEFRQHALVPRSRADPEMIEESRELKNLPPCDAHPPHKLDTCCVNCKRSVCKICTETEHRHHRHAPLLSLVRNMKDKLKTLSDDSLAEYMAQLREHEEQLKSCQEHSTKDLDSACAHIKRTAERLCEGIRQQERGLLRNIEATREEVTSKMDSTRQKLYRRVDKASSMGAYANSMRTDKDFMALLVKGDEVQQMFTKERKEPIPVVTWKSELTFQQEPFETKFGEFEWESETRDKLAVPLQELTRLDLGDQTPGDVAGLVAVGNRICVVHRGSPTLYVYSATGKLLHSLVIEGLRSAAGMVQVCKDPVQLAISDSGGKALRLAVLTDDFTLASQHAWQLKFQPSGLSVDCDGRLLVGHSAGRKILIINQTGEVIEKVQLSDSEDIESVQQAIRVDSYFVVADKKKCSIFWVNSSGNTLHKYRASDETERLLSTDYIAVDSERRVIVTDWANDRLILMSRKGAFIGQLVDENNDDDVTFGYTMLDRDRNLLYMEASVVNGPMQIRVYNYPADDIPLAPVLQDITHMKFKGILMSAPR